MLCTHRGEWVHFIYTVFQRKFIPGMAAIWDFEHKMMIEEEAMIQHKLEMYKQ